MCRSRRSWRVFLALVACVLGTACGPRAAPLTESGTPALQASERNKVMQIKFSRSGGVASLPGLTVQGTVDLKDDAPRVTDETAQYARALARPEAEQLRSIALALTTPQAREALARAGGQLRDAYHYDVTVVSADGRSHHVTFNAAGGAESWNRLAPGIGDLIQWIDAEAQKIRETRFTR